MEGDMNDFLAQVPFGYEDAVRLYAGCFGTILYMVIIIAFAFIVDLHHSSFPLFNCGLVQLAAYASFAYKSTTI